MARLASSDARPATATNTITRTTRSQSREPEHQPPERSSGRANRGNSVESDGLAPKPRPSKTVAQKGLTTINETERPASRQINNSISRRKQLSEVIVEEDEDEDDNGADVFALSQGRASAVSGLSGTTAKTSFSDEEVGEMDPDIMLDALPDLAMASDKLLEYLVPRSTTGENVPWSVWKDITTDGTKANKLFLARTKAFDVYKRNYGSSDYIQPSRVLRALFDVPSVQDILADAPRPDPIIRKANLATVLVALLITARDPLDVGGESSDALEAVDAAFASSVASDDFLDNDFEMACAIGTQLAIRRVAACVEDPNYDPQGIATGVFYEENDDGSWKYKYHDALHMETLTEEDLKYHLNTVEIAVDELKEPFGDASIDGRTAVNRLRAKHPWDKFIIRLIDYYKERKRSLNQQIKAARGVEGLIEDIRNVFQGKTELAFAQEMQSNLKRAAGTPRSTFDKSDINRLRALSGQKVHEASNQQPTISQGQAPTAQMIPSRNRETPLPIDSSAPLFFPSDDPAPAPSPPGARKMPPTKTGKPSLLDRQAGAIRVSWDDNSQSSEYETQAASGSKLQSVGNTAHQSNVDPSLRSNRLGKRPFMEHEDDDSNWDPTQDGAFETGTYDPALADDRRRRTAAILNASPRPATGATNGAGPSAVHTDVHGRMSSASASPTKRQRKNPGSSVLPPRPVLPRGSGEENPRSAWQRAKVDANHARVMAAQQRPPRVRRRWTEAEEICILNLIGECDEDSITYASLKAQEAAGDDILGERTAEDLRFKARNMKVTMLRAKQALWGGWAKVVLAKKDMDSLESMGIPYEQPAMRGRR